MKKQTEKIVVFLSFINMGFHKYFKILCSSIDSLCSLKRHACCTHTHIAYDLASLLLYNCLQTPISPNSRYDCIWVDIAGPFWNECRHLLPAFSYFKQEIWQQRTCTTKAVVSEVMFGILGPHRGKRK